MEKQLKIYTVEFNPLYPVPYGLLILAEDLKQATEIARNTLKPHQQPLGIELIEQDKPKVIFFENGDY